MNIVPRPNPPTLYTESSILLIYRTLTTWNMGCKIMSMVGMKLFFKKVKRFLNQE